jgi:glycosyltransferase involved in cell wall biosynthesis
VVKKAALILTVSEFERKNIISRLKLPGEKVEVLYNGVSPQFNNLYTTAEVTAFRVQYNLPEHFIMFLGNTAPKKNTVNVIKAFASYCGEEKNPVQLVLLDYKKELVLKILEEINQTDVIRHVVFPGYIPHAQMPLMYNAADLFLYPSLRESFGLPILEAMACGTPVITSNTSSMPEVSGSAAALVDPFNYLELTSAIGQLLSDTALREQYIIAGLERCKQFTWKVSAERLLAIYNGM